MQSGGGEYAPASEAAFLVTRGKGVVVAGDITLAVADVDLVYVGLRVLLASVGTLERLQEQTV